MDSANYELILPQLDDSLDQNEEWFILEHEGEYKKVKSHDYEQIYRVPGLYEDIFYNRLGCKSPNVVCDLLDQEMRKAEDPDQPLRVFDFGAGNGIVGEVIKEEMDCDLLVGVDILPEAKEAVERDRPGLYDDYYVLDMSCIDEAELGKFQSYNFNTLVTVAALGFGDIPTRAFVNAFNMLQDDAWVAFNLRDKFLAEEDNSGYREVLQTILDDSFSISQEKRYCHRRSIAGDEVCYHAIVGKKLDNIEDVSGLLVG